MNDLRIILLFLLLFFIFKKNREVIEGGPAGAAGAAAAPPDSVAPVLTGPRANWGDAEVSDGGGTGTPLSPIDLTIGDNNCPPIHFPSPCDNVNCGPGGTCKEDETPDSLVKCECEAPWTKTNPNNGSSPCDIGPCDKPRGWCGKGRCSDKKEGGTWKKECDCTGTDKFGKRCELPDQCLGKCPFHGHCTTSQEWPYWNCACNDGWTGDRCEHSPCEKVECNSHGKCHVEGGNAKCSCDNGWFGDTCENSPCYGKECDNGVCSVTNTEPFYECNCNGGWFQDHPGATPPCDVDICHHSPPCMNGGKCNFAPGVDPYYTCDCSKTDGWSGPQCSHSPCYENHCGPNSSCHVEDGKPTCSCNPGWTLGPDGQCVSNPCYPHLPPHCRDCIPQPTSASPGDYKCPSCDLGWTGNKCKISPCDGSNNNCDPKTTTCQTNNNKVSCECVGGLGLIKKDDISCYNPCSPNPCSHEGTCTVGDDGAICDCESPWMGPRCSTSPCSEKCSGHGICHTDGQSYNCKCSPHWDGKDCDICWMDSSGMWGWGDPPNCESPICPDQCGTHGICSPSPGNPSSPYCYCSPDWVSVAEQCDIHTKPCDNYPLCNDNNGLFVCINSPMYDNGNLVNYNCKLKCASPNICNNGGTCYVENDRRMCNCPSWTMGPAGGDPYCDKCSPPDINNCGHGGEHGTCFPPKNEFAPTHCECSPNWWGDWCASAISSCSPNHSPPPPDCGDHGTCHDPGSDQPPDCKCIGGWKGDLCKHSPCTGWECKNGGTCKYDLDSPSPYCHCVNGWSGSHCETSPCDSSDCWRTPGGGTEKCITSPLDHGGYSCICSTDWGGDLCKDPCVSFPCLHGGHCSPYPSSKSPTDYTCSPCPEGWTGKNCGSSIDPCNVIEPCGGHGICSPIRWDQHSCKCDPGWSGENCDIACNKHGDYDGQKCICKDGWGGENCSASPCSQLIWGSSPCGGHGECRTSSSPPYYKCDCYEDYWGCQCGSPNKCHGTEGSPCIHGDCLPATGSPGYICHCNHGWHGTQCSDPTINPCSSLPSPGVWSEEWKTMRENPPCNGSPGDECYINCKDSYWTSDSSSGFTLKCSPSQVPGVDGIGGYWMYPSPDDYSRVTDPESTPPYYKCTKECSPTLKLEVNHQWPSRAEMRCNTSHKPGETCDYTLSSPYYIYQSGDVMSKWPFECSYNSASPQATVSASAREIATEHIYKQCETSVPFVINNMKSITPEQMAKISPKKTNNGYYYGKPYDFTIGSPYYFSVNKSKMDSIELICKRDTVDNTGNVWKYAGPEVRIKKTCKNITDPNDNTEYFDGGYYYSQCSDGSEGLETYTCQASTGEWDITSTCLPLPDRQSCNPPPPPAHTNCPNTVEAGQSCVYMCDSNSSPIQVHCDGTSGKLYPSPISCLSQEMAQPSEVDNLDLATRVVMWVSIGFFALAFLLTRQQFWTPGSGSRRAILWCIRLGCVLGGVSVLILSFSQDGGVWDDILPRTWWPEIEPEREDKCDDYKSKHIKVLIRYMLFIWALYIPIIIREYKLWYRRPDISTAGFRLLKYIFPCTLTYVLISYSGNNCKSDWPDVNSLYIMMYVVIAMSVWFAVWAIVRITPISPGTGSTEWEDGGWAWIDWCGDIFAALGTDAGTVYNVPSTDVAGPRRAPGAPGPPPMAVVPASTAMTPDQRRQAGQKPPRRGRRKKAESQDTLLSDYAQSETKKYTKEKKGPPRRRVVMKMTPAQLQHQAAAEKRMKAKKVLTGPE